jgi:type III secretion system FlhB-like substrate exporter
MNGNAVISDKILQVSNAYELMKLENENLNNQIKELHRHNSSNSSNLYNIIEQLKIIINNQEEKIKSLKS